MNQAIQNTDITVVVQGPVQALADRGQEVGITHKCLRSVRKHLPGARIILSTWAAQNLDGLDYDELVINEDPGTNIRGYKRSGEPVKMNNNRQIASTIGGLKCVGTPYAMKLRSDNVLVSDAFKALQQRYTKRSESYRFLEERVVVCNLFTREYAKGKRVAFHLSDFFYFGLTKDLLKIWDLPFFESLSYDATRKGQIQHDGSLQHQHQYRLDCTQLLWLAALQKTFPELKLEHLLDCSGDKHEASNLCYANNLVIGAPDEVGLGLCQKFKGQARASRRSGRICFISYPEWQRLYRRYSDPSHKIEGDLSARLATWLWRCLLVFSRRPENELRLLKRRLRGY